MMRRLPGGRRMPETKRDDRKSGAMADAGSLPHDTNDRIPASQRSPRHSQTPSVTRIFDDRMSSTVKPGLFGRLRSGLSRTRRAFASGFARLFGTRALDAATVEDVEGTLLAADAGIEATHAITERLKALLRGGSTAAEITAALRESMLEILMPVAQPLRIPAGGNRPFVILVVGVNGSGKTTTIGKIAQRFKGAGQSVQLAAGDTFRAAAVEQLVTWGERTGTPVTAQSTGADSASVIYDALAAATARGTGVVIADTAGRLHTQSNLMEELRKVKRVLGKLDPSAPHEVLLVVDGTMGQNVLAQAAQFNQAVGVTGIALTKLDGTAKGGIVFALARQLGIPIRFIGVGEGADDLREFEAVEFVDALLPGPEA